MDFNTFASRVGSSYFEIKRPLFVILNDSDDVKQDFAEIANWIDMSYPTWLIFFRNETAIDDFFENIYVPFDCKLMVIQNDESRPNRDTITEIYQISRDKEIKHARFGTWSYSDGIRTPRLGLYQRRNDLFGQTIRVTSIYDPPGSLIDRDEDGNMVGLGGFFGGIMQLLEENMNCTLTYLESKTWGHRLANGTWTGTIGMLIEDEVDVVAAELMMTRDRLEAIEFTTPVYTTKCRTFIKRPSTTSLKWEAYVAPFTWGIWSAIGVIIIVTSLTISLVKSIVPIISEHIKDEKNLSSSFSDILLEVFGAFCSQGMEQSLLDPIRIIHLVIHLTGVVVLAAYSAALISSLATKTFVMPFTTMEGFLRDGTYRFGVVGDSADFGFFQNTTDEILKVLFDDVLTKETELPGTYLDGLTKVCEEDKYGFMTLDNVVSQLQPKVSCKLEPLDTITQSSIAMAVAPRSPYKGIIDSNILLIRDSGILQRLLNSEWMLSNKKSDSGWTTVEIEDVLPLIIVIIFGAFFSFLALGSEHIVTIKKKKKLVIGKKRLKKSNLVPTIILKKHNGVPLNLARF
ncbi:probable glutamate receptor [Venturia canescens]|uniref:probable glutamate receptor n=1 Tax=Venturia canescens TaxID=32260 RepID=UPI001C9C94BF|nr:probable glutamate receptor [Venturia canescens]